MIGTKRTLRLSFLSVATVLIALSVLLVQTGNENEGTSFALLAIGMFLGFAFYEFVVLDHKNDGGAA